MARLYDMNSNNSKSKHWVIAPIFAPVLPAVIFLIYLSAIRAPLLPFLTFPLPILYMAYLVFGPTYIFIYSRIVKENALLSMLGGFAIPIGIMVLLGGEFGEYLIWIGAFGAMCGLCFDVIFNGLKLNTKLKFDHEQIHYNDQN